MIPPDSAELLAEIAEESFTLTGRKRKTILSLVQQLQLGCNYMQHRLTHA